MNYVSTRGQAPAVGLDEAIAAGLAPDGGLYVPATWPDFSPADFDACQTLAEVAARLLQPFFAGSALADELQAVCEQAFDFDASLVGTHLPRTRMLELFHGPTASFKDFGARFLAASLARLHRADAPDETVLVATSGDTGAAVADAFHNLPGFRVVVLFPEGRVAPRQAHHLGSFGGNVTALRVAGGFDDCQRMVKSALGDAELAERCRLRAANSISLGRWLPQMAYYTAIALQWWREHASALDFVVPTGNLGNALACVAAGRMGLPIGEVTLATNANRTVPEYFAGAPYSPRPGIATLANAMDVGAPSNFERLRNLYPDDASLRAALRSDAVDDDAIRATIAAWRRRSGAWICPHTATAACVLARQREAGYGGDCAIVATAHPAKFVEVLAELDDDLPTPPAALARRLADPSQAREFPAADKALAEYLAGRA